MMPQLDDDSAGDFNNKKYGKDLFEKIYCIIIDKEHTVLLCVEVKYYD